MAKKYMVVNEDSISALSSLADVKGLLYDQLNKYAIYEFDSNGVSTPLQLEIRRAPTFSNEEEKLGFEDHEG